MSIEFVLKGALPPIVAALLFVSLAGARLLPLAVAVGVFVAYGLLKIWPAWPHQLWARPDGNEWVVWSLVAATLPPLLEHLRLLPGRIAAPLAVAVPMVGLWLLLQKVAANWSATEVALQIGAGGLLAGAVVAALRVTLRQAPASPLPAVLFSVMLTVDSVLVVLGHGALLGQLCGAVAAALGAAIGTTVWRRGFRLTAADAGWIGAAHSLFLLAGHHLTYLSRPVVLCALPAPILLLLLARQPGVRPWPWLLVALPLLLAPLGAALWMALPEPSPYGY